MNTRKISCELSAAKSVQSDHQSDERRENQHEILYLILSLNGVACNTFSRPIVCKFYPCIFPFVRLKKKYIFRWGVETFFFYLEKGRQARGKFVGILWFKCFKFRTTAGYSWFWIDQGTRAPPLSPPIIWILIQCRRVIEDDGFIK